MVQKEKWGTVRKRWTKARLWVHVLCLELFNFKGGLDGSVLHLPAACSTHPMLSPHPVLSLGRCFMAPASSLTGAPLRIHFHYRQWLFRALTLCSDSSHVTSCLPSLRTIQEESRSPHSYTFHDSKATTT